MLDRVKMLNEEEGRDSVVVDPLAAYSGISLFPSTFGILPDPSKPRDPGTDLYDIHKHLKSMVSKSPSKLMEQAKTILDGNSTSVQSEIAAFMVNNENKEGTITRVEENPHERRPALNRKRARFSLKPDARQPALNLEPTLDIKQLKNPEEFFLAYERLENAKHEIQKQTGRVLMNLNEQNPPLNVRQRRPGILGRSVRYKHQYSSITPENDENVVPSQETFETRNISTTIVDSEKGHSPPVIGPENENDEDDSDTFEDKDLVASITKSENKVNKILDELLSANCEDLEGDQAINKLQECLQIKPINLEKLLLPDLLGIQTMNLKYSRSFSKSSLRSVRNQSQRIETIKYKQNVESSSLLLASPSPLKSPLASLSSLKKQILLSNSSRGSFSAHDLDQSPTHSPPFEHSNDLSEIVDITNQSGVTKFKTPLTKDGGIVTKRTSLPQPSIGNVVPVSEISSKVLNIPQVGIDATSSGTPLRMEDTDIGGSNSKVIIIKKLSYFEDEAGALANVSNAVDEKEEEQEGFASEQPDTSNIMQMEGHGGLATEQPDAPDNVRMEERGGFASEQPDTTNNMQMEGHKGLATEQPDAPNNVRMGEDEVLASEQLVTSMVDAVKEQLIYTSSQLDKSADTFSGNDVDKLSGNGDMDLHDKVIPKHRTNKQRKGKKDSRRQSLAAAGTMWQCGVRRSTRIRTRPLQYWKGERLLYGRVHESLATVIGLKYESPAKGDAPPTLKVKSYVSDEYKELVELAALH